MAYRILVALDGSPASEATLPDIEPIALGGAAVHLLQVIPPGVSETAAQLKAAHDHALSYLGGLRERYPDMRGLDLIRTGGPADAILQAAQECDIHLIAMATCLCAVPSKGSLGSAAQTVVRRAGAAVLLREPSPLLSPRKLHRILVPLDNTDDSLSILATVQDLALRSGAEVVFLHVTDFAPSPLPLAPRRVTVAEDPKVKLLSLADRLEKSGLAYWQTIADGEPVAAILHHAATLDADLIAMTMPAVWRGDWATTCTPLAVLGGTERAVLFQKPADPRTLPNAWMFQ
jgi:nucleotide-binding universal stress UspA family protein